MIGIIGQTQGVRRAANPQIRPFKKMLTKDASARSSPSLSDFNSSITGVHRTSLLTGAKVEFDKFESVCAADTTSVKAAVSVPGITSVADPVTTNDAGRFEPLNEKSTGSGGVHV